MKVIEQIYDGSLAPEGQYRPKIDAYNKMQQKHMSKYDELMSYLQRHDKSMAAMLQAYNDELFELPALETESVFVDGFRLGALLMIEIMTSL